VIGEDAFVLAHTVLDAAPLVPEIRLHLASEITPIWQATEAWLAEHNVAPPFWAFAWPGGQALARHVLDHPADVAGRRVVISLPAAGSRPWRARWRGLARSRRPRSTRWPWRQSG
jgi:predicted nicotinamide N-methyase